MGTKLKVTLDGKKLNTIERREKAQLIAEEMQIVYNSDVFKEVFLDLLDKRDYKSGELSKWAYETPDAIYAYFMNGVEILSPELDYEVDFFLDDYYTIKRVIGHTYPSDKYVYTNTRYFDVSSSKMSGSNFTHEYGHKKGFKHDFRRTSRRNDSLCYILNDAYEIAWERIFGDVSERDKRLVCKRVWYKLWIGKKCWWVTSAIQSQQLRLV